MSNSILETMASNLSIVASDIPVNSYILKDYANGRVCNARDIKALSGHIGDLLDGLEAPPAMFEYSVRNRAEQLLEYIVE